MLRDRLGVSERWACRVCGQHRSTERYEPKRAEDDAALRAELRRFSVERPRWGYRRAHHRLREEGWSVNRKRVQRLWREEGRELIDDVAQLQRPPVGGLVELEVERPHVIRPLGPQPLRRDGRLAKPATLARALRHSGAGDAGGARHRRRPHGERAGAARRRARRRPGAAEDGQRHGDDRQRAQGLVPVLEDRNGVHRARLAVAEPVRGVLPLPRTRRAARRRGSSPAWPRHAS